MLRLPTVVTSAQVSVLLKELEGAIKPGQQVVTVDASDLEQLDSSCIAMLLSLRRSAQAQGSKFGLRHAPASLQSLLHVYGLAPLFNDAALAAAD